MQLVIKKIQALWNDESAQGATEYILLIAIVVGLAMLFRDKIKSIVTGKLSDIEGGVNNFKPEGGL